LSLCSGRTAEAAITHPVAVWTGTIPLRKSAARRAAQYLHAHFEGGRL
jgi:hypothetical protein